VTCEAKLVFEARTFFVNALTGEEIMTTGSYDTMSTVVDAFIRYKNGAKFSFKMVDEYSNLVRLPKDVPFDGMTISVVFGEVPENVHSMIPWRLTP
jgi:hypothetical protein